MSIAVAMFDRYTALMARAETRALMSAVVQNTHNETLDFEKSVVAVAEMVDRDRSILNAPRREIIGFFNAMWMSNLSEIPDAFWWEMRFRLLKLVAVSITLEALNLKIILGATRADKHDIPQALVFVKERLDACTDESMYGVSSAFDSACAKQKDLCDAYLRHFSRDD